MPDQTKNILIGIFVTTAIAIMIFVLLFLHPSVGDNGKTLNVRFTNIDKVSKGTRVTFAGRPVGEVVKIKEVDDARTEQQYRKGDVYIWELTLKVDSGIDVFESDDISVRTSGLLGERSIEITPKPPKEKAQLRQVSDNEIAFAKSVGSVEDALETLNRLARKAGRSFDALTDEINTLKKNKFAENISKTAENLNEITASMNKPQQWSDIVTNLHTFTKDINSFEQRVENSWTKVDTALDNFNHMSLRGVEISNNISRGEGTIGRLIVNDDLYMRLVSVLNKAETVMNDINHYGLLFDKNKAWQRLRARRMNLLAQLSTPQEFRNFFQDEIDQISTSISRVSMVLTESGSSCDEMSMVCSPEFAGVFVELLRRITALEENIKLYDQQVVEEREKRCCSFECQED